MTWFAVGIAAAGLVHSIRTDRQNSKVSRNTTKTLLDQQNARQEKLDAFGKPLLGQGQENLNLTQDYLRRLGSGDRSLTQQTLAPEINQLTQGAQGSVAAQRGMYPRGGQTASQAAQLPYQLQGNINNLLFSARPQAMQQLGQLGSNQASLGLAAMGQGAGLTNSMLQYGLDARQQQMQQGAALGQGLGGIAQLLMYYNQNRTDRTNPLSAYVAKDNTPTNPATSFTLLGNQGSNSGTLGGQATQSSGSYNPYQTPGSTQRGPGS